MLPEALSERFIRSEENGVDEWLRPFDFRSDVFGFPNVLESLLEDWKRREELAPIPRRIQIEFRTFVSAVQLTNARNAFLDDRRIHEKYESSQWVAEIETKISRGSAIAANQADENDEWLAVPAEELRMFSDEFHDLRRIHTGILSDESRSNVHDLIDGFVKWLQAFHESDERGVACDAFRDAMPPFVGERCHVRFMRLDHLIPSGLDKRKNSSNRLPAFSLKEIESALKFVA